MAYQYETRRYFKSSDRVFWRSLVFILASMIFCALVYTWSSTQVHADQKSHSSTAAQIGTDHLTAAVEKSSTETSIPHLQALMKRIKLAREHHTRDRAAESELKTVVMLLTENFNAMNRKMPENPLYNGKISNIKAPPVKTSKPDPTHPPTTK